MLDRRPLLAGAALAAFALLACAGPAAAPRAAAAPRRSDGTRETVLQSASLRFPEEQFIVGFGEGDGPAAAEQAAQNDAAAQIRSTISSNASRSLSAVTTGAGEQITKEFVERTVVQVVSDAGAFIRPKRELTRQAGDGTWYAVAAADRRELDQKYVDEGRQLEIRFRELAAQVRGARSWLDAARPYCDLKALADAVDRKDLERYMVSRARLWTPELQAMRGEAVRAHQAAKGRLRITVARPTEALRTDPADAIVGSMTGWSATAASAASCAGEGVLVAPTVDAQCRSTQLGIVLCRASLRVEARACGSEASIFTVTTAPVEATDSREQERARANVLRRLGAQEVVAPAAQEAVGKLRAILGERCAG
jgi:hypothetical protein